VEDIFPDAGFFTSSGGTPERAGLMSGYIWLMNLYIMKESCHAIANEKPFYPGGKKNTWNRYFFIFPSDERKLNKHSLIFAVEGGYSCKVCLHNGDS